MRLTTCLRLIAIVPPLLVAACAGAGVGSGGTSPLIPAAAAANAPADTASGDYVLSANEQKLNCKQISGRMQVRILQVRDYNERMRASQVSRGLQSAFAGTFGNSSKGVDPDGSHAADLKMLRAYNQLLVAKGCKSYDLDSELQQRDPLATPATTVPPPKGKAPQQ
jgi:hypothetical protein